MNDSTTPDPAEQERRERIPSLQGDTPIINPNPTVDEILARVQAGRHRNLTITTVEQEEDDSYTVTFRYLTNNEATRTILASRRVRPLSPASKRALWTLERMPHVLKRHRNKSARGGKKSPYPLDARQSKAQRALEMKAEGKSWREIARRLYTPRSTIHDWSRKLSELPDHTGRKTPDNRNKQGTAE